jgi:hypothetical protein
LDDWKRNLAREARPTIDLNLIQNQSTCIEKVSQKNNNKIRQHEKTNQSFNSPSPPPLSNPFTLKKLQLPLPLPSILTTGGGACGQPPLPPQQPAMAAAAIASLEDPVNVRWWLRANHIRQLALLDKF